MAAPQIYVLERDLSARISANFSFGVGMVLPSHKGSLDPKRITTPDQLWKEYTLEKKYKRGANAALLLAEQVLQRSNDLWVVRAEGSGALYGGAVIVRSGGTVTQNYSLTAGLADPEDYVWQEDDLLLIVGKDPGAWNNSLSITLDTDIYGETWQYKIHKLTIFDPYSEEPEVIEFSLDPEAKLPNGTPCFAESISQTSNYIRIYVNPANADASPIAQTEKLNLAGGVDGSEASDGEMLTALSKMASKDAYPMTLVIDSGMATVTYHQAITQFCEERKDCFGILSTPYDAEASSDYLSQLIDYVNSQLNVSSSYVGIYTPHLRVYQKDINDYLYISPAGMVAAAFADTAFNYEVWYPVAGWMRGKLTVLDVRRRFSRGELNSLYDNRINPIRYATGKGIAIWGVKTLWALPTDLDRINVRMLLIIIENQIAENLDTFLFDLNGEELWTRMKFAVESYMRNIQARNGVYDFYVQCDSNNNTPEDIDNYRVNLDLYVKPTKVSEYIHFTTVIVRTGMDFNVAIGLAA